MRTLATSSFDEFYTSEFVSEFIDEDWTKGRCIFESPETKLVAEEQEEMFDRFCIYSFYRKGSRRWVKKMEASNEQMMFDCEVSLMGEDKTGDPVSIVFDMGNDTFEFVLSQEMVKALRDAIEYDFEGYYPNLSED